MKKFKKIIRYCLFLGLLFGLGLSLLVGWFFYIQQGLIKKIEYSGLKVESLKISPWKGFQINNIRLKQDGIELEVPEVLLSWHFRGLLEGKMDLLRVSRPRLVSVPETSLESKTPPEEIQTQSETSSSPVSLPLDLHLPLTVEKIELLGFEALPFDTKLTFRASLHSNQLRINELNATSHEYGKLVLKNLLLMIGQESKLQFEELFFSQNEQKICSLKSFEGNLQPNHLVNNMDLGSYSLRSLVITTIPVLPKHKKDPDSLVQTENSQENTFPLTTDLNRVQNWLEKTIPGKLPIHSLGFQLSEFKIEFLDAGVKNLDLKITSPKIQLSAGVQYKEHSFPLKVAGDIATRSLNIQSEFRNTKFHILQEDQGHTLNLHGPVQLNFEKLCEKGSRVQLAGNLHSELPDFEMKLPFELSLQDRKIGFQAKGVQIEAHPYNLIVDLDSVLSIQDLKSIELKRFLVSQIQIQGPQELQIQSIELQSSLKNYQSLKGSVLVSDTRFSLMETRIPAVKTQLVGEIPGMYSLDLEIEKIENKVLKTGPMSFQAKVFNNHLDFVLVLKKITSKVIGNLSEVQLNSQGPLQSLSASYILSHYVHVDSKIPYIKGKVSIKPGQIHGKTIISGSKIKIMDFLSFKELLNYTGGSSEPSKEPVETTTNNLNLIWDLRMEQGKHLHLDHEMGMAEIQPEIQFNSQDGLLGTIRVLNAIANYGGQELRLLETGYVKLRKKTGSQSVQSISLSTSTSSIEDQLTHLWNANQAQKSNQFAYLGEGVEVNFKLGMNYDGEDLVLKVTGSYPDFHIDVYDSNGEKIKDGIAGLLQKKIKAVTDSKKNQANDEMDTANLLTEQAASVANGQIDSFFNNKLKGQGLKLKSSFIPGGAREFGIEKKLGGKFILEYFRSQSGEEEVLQTRKIQYKLKGKSSLFLRQDDMSGGQSIENSFGLQRRIKF